MRLLRRILKGLLISLLGSTAAAAAALLSVNAWVLFFGSRGIIAEAKNLPKQATGLVLGTSPRSAGGGAPNPFFEGRMDTTARLFQAGILERVLVSGDNRVPNYNEPAAMRDALLQRGVPSSAISMDSAGIRTLDSIVRAQKTFHLENNLVIVTDDFHLPRAMFLAAETGLQALGFASEHVPWRRSYRTRIREWFSRGRACLDIYFWKTQPPISEETEQNTPPPGD
jgi:SanA protein